MLVWLPREAVTLRPVTRPLPYQVDKRRSG